MIIEGWSPLLQLVTPDKKPISEFRDPYDGPIHVMIIDWMEGTGPKPPWRNIFFKTPLPEDKALYFRKPWIKTPSK
jgi:hypothetical protein